MIPTPSHFRLFGFGLDPPTQNPGSQGATQVENTGRTSAETTGCRISVPVLLFVAKHDLHEILDNQLIITLNTI